ncbi:MAG: biotin--[acetyl-CoA-carboxylase] ligase, partial [Burkholderiaceae bacterium]
MQAPDPSGAAPLDASGIARAMALAGCRDGAVEAVTVTGSTNEDLVAQARVRQPSGPLVRAASFQTSGRGRRQRLWRAAPNDALLFSVSIPVAVRPASLPAITLACGVALADRLATHSVAVQLKWPNDIRINGCKLAGILTELVTDRNAAHTLVIGVGMNLHLDDAARSAIGQPAIALDQVLGESWGKSAPQSREQWIGNLGGAIVAASARFMQDGFGPFHVRFNQLLESRGEMVDVSQ